MSRTHGFTTATCTTTTATAMALLCSPAAGAIGPADTDGGMSAQQLVAQARAGVQKAKSVRLDYTDRGAQAKASTTQPTSMKLALDRKGNCTGTMALGEHGGTVQIVKRGTEVWLKPDAAFWKAELPGRQGAAAAAKFKDRYLHGSASDTPLSGIADACDLGVLQRDVTKGAALPSSVKKDGETALDGTKVIPLSFQEKGVTSTQYVTADPAHHLYRTVKKGGGTDLTMTLTDYDKPVSTKTPPAKESVDVSKLKQELQGL